MGLAHYSQFRLRTLLVAVAILAAPLAWVGWQLNWIRQRHEILFSGVTVWLDEVGSPSVAPSCLGLFGEQGILRLRFQWDDQEELELVQRLEPAARRLFPEAEIELLHYTSHPKVPSLQGADIGQHH